MRIARAAVLLPVLALLHIHFHREFHGPPFDYVGLALAAGASWIGIPGPGEPLLIAAGVLAAKHQLAIGSVVLVAWAAATIGGVIGWLVGMVAGRAVLTAPGPLRSFRIAAAQRGEQIFERHPVIAIVVTPSWIAGIHRVRGRIYQPTNAGSALLWAAGLGFGSYLIGPSVLDLFQDVGVVFGLILGVAVVAIVLTEIRRRTVRRRGRRGGPGNPPAAQPD